MHDHVNNIISKLDVRTTKADRWEARCPAHDDRNASLSVTLKGEKVLMHCHAGCTTHAVLAAIGLRMKDLFPTDSSGRSSRGGKLVATYDYVSEAGELLYQKLRFQPKDFRQRRPDGKGGWIHALGDVRRVLYRLPEVLAADTVVVVEGEKDADNLRSLGVTATTNVEGAGGHSKWRPEYTETLRGKHVILIPDNDAPGLARSHGIADALAGVAASVRWAVVQGHKDVSDWIAAGGSSGGDVIPWLNAAGPVPAATTPTTTPPTDHIQLGQPDPSTGKLVISPKRTLPTAEAYVREFHTHPDGTTLVTIGAGVPMAWRNNRYEPVDGATIRKRLFPWLHAALRPAKNKSGEIELLPFESNPTTVEAALKTILAHTNLPEQETPSWITPRPDDPPADEILPCHSVNIHLPTNTTMQPTPRLFTPASLDFDYDSDAPEPTRWLSFLDEVFSGDKGAEFLLQQWAGYLLTQDTSQQKMLLAIGPKRSGKGTVARILRRLIGVNNVAGPTISSLAGQFGLQPLIGKTFAIVSDARFSGQDSAAVVERLLCISGEDLLTVEQKFLPSVTMKLPTRFMFLSNELPRLSDASGALAGRFLVLKFTQSFYGREDSTLVEQLSRELPGILQWAIEGWHILRSKGRFEVPESSLEAMNELEDALSEVGMFVRECCTVGTNEKAWVDDVYKTWKQWCEGQGRDHPGTVQNFGRQLAAAVPSLRRHTGTGNARFYSGLSLKVAL